MNEKIIVIPLDDRPVNTRYPQMLGSIANVDVVLPPHRMLGRARVSAGLDDLFVWLNNNATDSVRAALVSTDFLGWGNLINSRISDDTSLTALRRLNILAEINTRCPVHAFSVITRIPCANDGFEEPDYWSHLGVQLHRFSNLWARHEAGSLNGEEVKEFDKLIKDIPQDLRRDWLTRRLRNHIVNLALVEAVSREQLSSLLITSDDTASDSLSSDERDWLNNWGRLVTADNDGRLQMYPGADEVGSVLLARTVNAMRSHTPKIWIDYSTPGDGSIVAPYEDRPVSQTIQLQIRSAGCIVADKIEEADFVLAVATPSPRRSDYRPEFLADDRRSRTGAYLTFVRRLSTYQSQGLPIAIADVAYPNGADPLFMEILFDHATKGFDLSKLAAFGAWNTAGNTLGVVIAQASLSIDALSPEAQQAQQLFLAHRFLEDYGYQSVVRRRAREYCRKSWHTNDPGLGEANAQKRTEVIKFVAEGLTKQFADLQHFGIGQGMSLNTGSVGLPWDRLFEADFEIEG